MYIYNFVLCVLLDNCFLLHDMDLMYYVNIVTIFHNIGPFLVYVCVTISSLYTIWI